MIIVSDFALEKLFKIYFQDSALPVSWNLKLFVNDLTPGNGDYFYMYSEMNTNGYVQKTIDEAQFSVSLQAGVVFVEIPNKTFNFTEGEPKTVYGWYLTCSDGSEQYLIAAERFDTPITVSQTGDQITVGGKIYMYDGIGMGWPMPISSD